MPQNHPSLRPIYIHQQPIPCSHLPYDFKPVLPFTDKLHCRPPAKRVEETGGLSRPHRRLRHGRLRVQAVGHLPQDLRHVLWLGVEAQNAAEGSKNPKIRLKRAKLGSTKKVSTLLLL